MHPDQSHSKDWSRELQVHDSSPWFSVVVGHWNGLRYTLSDGESGPVFDHRRSRLRQDLAGADGLPANFPSAGEP